MYLLILGLALFFSAHSVSILRPGLRQQAIERIGALAWRAGYSIVSLAGFICIVVGYDLARQAPLPLYVPPVGLRQLGVWLMLPVFPLLAAAYLKGRIQRAVKHPMLLGTKIWSLAHLFANGMLADVLLFGSFLLWAGLDRMSLKRRAPTFGSAAAGRPWNDTLAVMLGLGIYAAFVFGLHEKLIGVPVLAMRP